MCLFERSSLNLALHFQHESRSPASPRSRVSMETRIAAGAVASPPSRGRWGVLTQARRSGQSRSLLARVQGRDLGPWNQPRGGRLFQENLQLLQVRSVLHGELALTGHRTPHATRHTPPRGQGSERHRSEGAVSSCTWPPSLNGRRCVLLWLFPSDRSCSLSKVTAPDVPGRRRARWSRPHARTLSEPGDPVREVRGSHVQAGKCVSYQSQIRPARPSSRSSVDGSEAAGPSPRCSPEAGPLARHHTARKMPFEIFRKLPQTQ